MELAQDVGVAPQHPPLAQLELQQQGLDARLLEAVGHDLGEVAAHELAQGHVDGDARVEALVEPGAHLPARRA